VKLFEIGSLVILDRIFRSKQRIPERTISMQETLAMPERQLKRSNFSSRKQRFLIILTYFALARTQSGKCLESNTLAIEVRKHFTVSAFKKDGRPSLEMSHSLTNYDETWRRFGERSCRT